MPIPPFDGILNVLPPHLGDPRYPEQISPYQCTYLEVCTQFGTSPKRKEILRGLLELRLELLGLGIQGYQWLGGSFVEDIESHENRGPNDVDVVTLIANPPRDELARLVASRQDLFLNHLTKPRYFVDHFYMSFETPGRLLVNTAKYWYALFSHRRDDLWKGMLHVNLVNPVDDNDAKDFLGATP